MAKKNNTDKDEMLSIKRYVIEYSKRAIEIEADKEKMLTKNFNSMIFFNSILLIPLISIIVELCIRMEDLRLFVLIFGPILVGVVLASLLLCMIGQRTSNKNYSRSGIFLLKHIDLKNKSIDEETIIDRTIKDLDTIYINKKHDNLRRSKLLISSHIVIYSFYTLLIAFGIVIMILM